MLCPNCSWDKFRMIDIFREKRHIPGKGWVYDNDVDTRKIRCKGCGEVFITETKLQAVERRTESKRLKIEPLTPELFN